MRPVLVDLNKAGVSVLLFEDGIRVEVPYSTALFEARLLVAPSGAARPTEHHSPATRSKPAEVGMLPPALAASGTADGGAGLARHGDDPSVRNLSRWDDMGLYLERWP